MLVGGSSCGEPERGVGAQERDERRHAGPLPWSGVASDGGSTNAWEPGDGALVVFGLVDEPSSFVAGSSLLRSGAAALSLGLTAAGMTCVDSADAAAAATTLIVSLGILTTALQLGVLMAVVVGLAYQGVAINRLAGLRIAWWR